MLCALLYLFPSKQKNVIFLDKFFFCLKWEQPCIEGKAAFHWIPKRIQWSQQIKKMANGSFRRYSGHFESFVSNSYYGMLRGQIHANLPPEHQLLAIWNNKIHIGCRIAEIKVRWWRHFKVKMPIIWVCLQRRPKQCEPWLENCEGNGQVCKASLHPRS